MDSGECQPELKHFLVAERDGDTLFHYIEHDDKCEYELEATEIPGGPWKRYTCAVGWHQDNVGFDGLKLCGEDERVGVGVWYAKYAVSMYYGGGYEHDNGWFRKDEEGYEEVD